MGDGCGQNYEKKKKNKNSKQYRTSLAGNQVESSTEEILFCRRTIFRHLVVIIKNIVKMTNCLLS